MDVMKMTPDEAAALGNLNPRRYDLLLQCLTLEEPFTAADVSEALRCAGTETVTPSSLSRDLRGLEAGGLLCGEPGMKEARRGRTVHFRTTALAEKLFAQLDEHVRSALERRSLR